MQPRAVSSPVYARHDLAGHPESQRRLENALRGLPPSVPVEPPFRCQPEDIERVHLPGYRAWLERFCAESRVPRHIDVDTYVTAASYDVACWAAGGAVRAAELALDGIPAFAFVRPPGHHATRGRAMGFCLINNVAVAAAWALDRVPRVAIVDWDEHHGNGTQDIFYENPQVLYCSVHEGGSYPGTGRLEERGCGDGDGYTINVPLPRGSRGADFATAFSEVFIPALRRFDPLLLLISAGQDILSDDPLGGMCVEPQDVGAMLGLLLGAFRTPVALVLEGGYGPSHADAIRAIFGALQGGECAFVPGEASAETVRVVRDARSVHGL